jgi:predicted DNA-binding transcriptional regulator AlpA
MTDRNEDRLLSQTELAERWNITPRTLQLWYAKGKGPKRVNIGKKGYRLSDVLKYEEEQAQEPGTKAPTRVFKEEHRAMGVEARKRAREARKAEKPTE